MPSKVLLYGHSKILEFGNVLQLIKMALQMALPKASNTIISIKNLFKKILFYSYERHYI